jgi:hypothetical protein
MSLHSVPMTDVIPAAVPATPVPPPRRGTWITVFGVLDILIGGAVLLCAAVAAFGILMAHSGAFPTPTEPPPTGVALLSVVMLLAVAGLFVALGIGTLRLSGWVRITMLVTSGFWLITGVLMSAVLAFMLPGMMKDANAARAAGLVIVIITFIMVVLPAVLLFFYTRPSTREAFARRGAVGGAALAEPARPTSLVLLSILFALGGLGIFYAPFTKVSVLFGTVVHGALAVTFGVVMSILSAWAGWLLYRRKLRGWWLGLFISLFSAASISVTLLRADPVKIYQDMGMNEQAVQTIINTPLIFWVSWSIALAMVALMIGLLIHVQKYMTANGGSPPPAPEAGIDRPI